MVAIQSSVACIIAREVAEGFFFTTSHVGMVLKTDTLPATEKRRYLIGLATGVLSGLIAGSVIAIAVGFSLEKALGNQLDTVSNGVEAGEAASKLIASWFVASLALKIPKWFGISNFVRNSDKPVNSQVEKATEKFESVEALALSLFWNVLREATEGGILTALAIVLAEGGMESWPESVGVGVAAAVVLGGGLAVGAKYVSKHVFGIAAVVIIGFLSVGLITGAARSFEEVYESEHEEETSGLIYDYGDTEKGDALSSLEFMGISGHMTVLTLIVWVGSILLMTFLQIWHHYFGYHIIHPAIRTFCASVKRMGVARKESESTSTDKDKEKDIEASPENENSADVDMKSNPSADV